jgi:hypothetical protein
MRKRLRFALPLPIALAALAVAIPAGAPAASAPAPVFKPSRSDVIFDGIRVGATSAQKTTTIKNAGGANLQISKVELRGPHQGDFVITSDSCTGKVVAPSATCVLGFAFKPAAGGTRVSHVRISDNTPCVNWITLAGSGTEPVNPTASAATCETAGDTPTTTPGQDTTTTTPGQDTSAQGNGVLGVSQGGAPIGKCKSNRKVRIHFRGTDGRKFKSVKVTIAKQSFPVKYWRVTRRYQADLSFVGRRSGRYTVKIRGTLTNGKSFKQNRHFVTCVSGKTPTD